ncbi:hypothetical protein F5Y18DRAFT_131848 [Xylariaceae sp. FL1019]|nr:hypothetical protein F5Y18DRAFT_131848 [Xylariaceae sp. FL1019]
MMNWWKQRQAKHARKRTAHQTTQPTAQQSVDYRDRWPTAATLVDDHSPASSLKPTWSDRLSSRLYRVRSLFIRRRDFGPGESTHPYDIAYSQPILEESELHMSSSMNVQPSERGRETWRQRLARWSKEQPRPPSPVEIQPATILKTKEKPETPKNVAPLPRLQDIPRSRTATPAGSDPERRSFTSARSPLSDPRPALSLARTPLHGIQSPQVASQQPRTFWFSPKLTPTPVPWSVTSPVAKTPVPTVRDQVIEEPAPPGTQPKPSRYTRFKRRWSTTGQQAVRV